MAILTLNKVKFMAKNITKDKEWHFIMIKWSIDQKDTKILNAYESNKF